MAFRLVSDFGRLYLIDLKAYGRVCSEEELQKGKICFESRLMKDPTYVTAISRTAPRSPLPIGILSPSIGIMRLDFGHVKMAKCSD